MSIPTTATDPIYQLHESLGIARSMLLMLIGPGLESFESCHARDQSAYIAGCFNQVDQAWKLLDSIDMELKKDTA